MKKILIVFVCMVIFGSVALASPLSDYSAGKGAVDLTWRDTNFSLNANGSSGTMPSKYNFDGSITVGLGENFAVQYRNFSPTSNSEGYSDAYGTEIQTWKMTTNEFNVLYKVDKSVAVFAGFVSAQGTANNISATGQYLVGSVSTNTKNCWQIGVLGSTPIADKTNLWASVAAGSDITNFDVGVSYAFCPGWEFNVDYRDIKVNKLVVSNINIDTEAKGLGLGVTYKF